MYKAALLNLLVCNAVLLHGQAPANPTPINFSGRLQLESVTNDQLTAVADFNGDGIPDVAILGSQVEIYLGDGKGGFRVGPYTTIAGGPTITSYALSDLNGDGLMDIAAATNGPDMIYLFLNNGDGSFQVTTVATPNLGAATTVFAADINGDGIPDLLFEDTVAFYAFVNLGSAQFQLSQTVNFQHLTSMTVGDVNGDGIPDVLVNFRGTVTSIWLLLGTGSGTFTLNRYFVSPTGAGIYLADMNADGSLDLLTAGPKSFAVQLGNGTGQFGQPKYYDYGAAGLVIADMNHDGLPDVVITENDQLGIFYGNGGGNLSAPVVYLSTYRSGIPVAASLRNNGQMDLVMPAEFNACVLLATATGFKETPTITGPTGATAIASADFNGDGHPDLVVTAAATTQIYMGTGTAAKPFTQGSVIPSGAISVVTGDFNGDGKADIAFLTSGGQVGVALGKGDGTFAAPVFSPAGPLATVIAAGDLNGDGKLDLATTGISILFGNGDGSFQAPISIGTQGYYSIGFADFNNDGRLDLYAGLYLNLAEFAVFLNQGQGVLGPPIVTGQMFGDVMTTADINGDGVADVVGTNVGDLTIMLGKGDGTFQPGKRFSNFFNPDPTQIVVGNFAGNGRKDVLVLDAEMYEVTPYTSLGGVSYNRDAEGWGTNPGPVGMVSGFFHGQKSKPDLAVANGDGTINIFINTSQ